MQIYHRKDSTFPYFSKTVLLWSQGCFLASEGRGRTSVPILPPPPYRGGWCRRCLHYSATHATQPKEPWPVSNSKPVSHCCFPWFPVIHYTRIGSVNERVYLCACACLYVRGGGGCRTALRNARGVYVKRYVA